MIVPLYIGELVPTKHRGRVIVIGCMSITGGQVFVYAIAAAFGKVNHNWRYMVGLGGVPSISPTLYAIVGFKIPMAVGSVVAIIKVGRRRILLHNVGKFRAVGTMMITCTCWGMNIIISSTFLSMMKGMTPSGALGFYAAINLLGWLFIIFSHPEVAVMPLEQVRMLFEDDFGVKHARVWRKDNAE
ncbi:hypothetical protein BDZ85DRAFT_285609 [Elsinoe ampelina]|uniref:Major facilitator superfamily (MFS) profile domain-containing protein n=1 Tax=Elsinoe ampelina TaxID=302913 RepID=A0A6A6G0U7_9PEZI|nr:hypothetical protein BDZ85DRAFT_285609 [Elsinoe ampelina]